MNKTEIVKAISNVKASNIAVNASIQSKLVSRAKLEKTTEKASRHMLNCCVAISMTSYTLNDKSDIANRNVYALEKVTHILNSLRNESLATSKTFVSHVVNHVKNMSRRKNNSMNNKQRQATTSLDIEDETMRANDKRAHYAISTASTQTSSTAYALESMSIADYDKENKMMTLSETENSEKFVELCKTK